LRFDSNGYAVFKGEVSLQNNGGFASVWFAPSIFQTSHREGEFGDECLICKSSLGDGL